MLIHIVIENLVHMGLVNIRDKINLLFYCVLYLNFLTIIIFNVINNLNYN